MIVFEILKAFFSYLNLPAIILAVFLFAAWAIIRKASAEGHFSFANMLKDDSGKESLSKLGILVSLAISSWIVMFQVMHTEKGDPTVLLIYLSAWAAVPVSTGFADALKNKWSNKG